jgi:hypothetical protein
MSRANRKLAALAVLLSLEFLSLGLLINGIFYSSHTPFSATARADGNAARLVFPGKPDGSFVPESYGEPTSQSGFFLTPNSHSGISRRRFVVSRLFIRTTLAPKVSRYISKSVLNL